MSYRLPGEEVKATAADVNAGTSNEKVLTPVSIKNLFAGIDLDNVPNAKILLRHLANEVVATLAGGLDPAQFLGNITSLSDNLAAPASSSGKWYFVSGVSGTMTGSNPPGSAVEDGGYVFSDGASWQVRAASPVVIPANFVDRLQLSAQLGNEIPVQDANGSHLLVFKDLNNFAFGYVDVSGKWIFRKLSATDLEATTGKFTEIKILEDDLIKTDASADLFNLTATAASGKTYVIVRIEADGTVSIPKLSAPEYAKISDLAALEIDSAQIGQNQDSIFATSSIASQPHRILQPRGYERQEKSALATGTAYTKTRQHTKAKQIICTFIDDDCIEPWKHPLFGSESDPIFNPHRNGFWTGLRPVFYTKGVPCCEAAIFGNRTTETDQRLWACKQLQDHWGWEILSHSTNHYQVDPEGNSSAQGTCTITVSGPPTANDTIQIGKKRYKFVVTQAYDGEIQIDGTLATMQANIVAAINGTDGVNTAHPQVTIGAFSANSATITTISPVSANKIPVVDQADNISFSAAWVATGGSYWDPRVEWIESFDGLNALGITAKSAVYPYGGNTHNQRQVVRETYRCGIGVGGYRLTGAGQGVNRPPLATYGLSRYSLDNLTSPTSTGGAALPHEHNDLAQWQADFDTAKALADNGDAVWMIFMIHSYNPVWTNWDTTGIDKDALDPSELSSDGQLLPNDWGAGESGYNPDWVRALEDDYIDPAWRPQLNTRLHQLWQFIQYIKDSGADILTVDQALDRVGNLVDVGDFTHGGYSNDDLPADQIEHPHHVIGIDGSTSFKPLN